MHRRHQDRLLALLRTYPVIAALRRRRGGFPDSHLVRDDASLTWRQQFVQTCLTRDLLQLGLRLPRETRVEVVSLREFVRELPERLA